ncbi:recombination regulator RecX [Morganella morganii]|nr:recombination regulator RecX [Morganella morganii]
MDEKQLYHYAIWLLGRREYAGAELTRKLKRKIAEKQETSPTEEHVLPRVMARLTDSQYLDDTRSIALFFSGRCEKNCTDRCGSVRNYVRKGLTVN